MRVRSFQTYLAGQRLINTAPLSELRGLRLGVDAVIWLRTLPNLKDPLADAIGGPPAMLAGILDATIEQLNKYGIELLFVFQGLQVRSHMLFGGQLHAQMDLAWRQVAEGEYLKAQHLFAQATSRINGDFIYMVSHHLQRRGCQVIQAPYYAGAQLAYYGQEGAVDAVFGPPALLLLGVPRVIININLATNEFDWVDKQQLLTTWGISESQFADACLLAGTEYCLTYPYLNLAQFLTRTTAGCQFATALDFVRQAPLAGYMCHFPQDHMKAEHVEGYAFCKCLITYPLAFSFNGTISPVKRASKASNSAAAIENAPQTANGGVTNLMQNNNEAAAENKTVVTSESPSAPDGTGQAKNLGPPQSSSSSSSSAIEARSGEEPVSSSADSNVSTTALVKGAEFSDMPELPDDFHKIFGVRLPNAVFLLMAKNFIGRKLPSVIAFGEWCDLSHPTVDSVEYRDLLSEVTQYRSRALGLLAMRLHPELRGRKIRLLRYTCTPPTGATTAELLAGREVGETEPNCSPGMSWDLKLEELQAEMRRQSADRITYRFCLEWHANELQQGRNLCGGTPPPEAPPQPVAAKLQHLDLLVAHTFFAVLENLGYFTPDGGITVFGSALAAAGSKFVNEALFALELMKCGALMGEPLEAPPERPFPENVTFVNDQRNAPQQTQILLLSRVVSLVPMTLLNRDLWLAPVDFDLAAFHCVVKLLKKTFRALADASLANVLLEDMSLIQKVPHSAIDPLSGLFPTFLLPRNCLGVIMKHFLEFEQVCEKNAESKAVKEKAAKTAIQAATISVKNMAQTELTKDEKGTTNADADAAAFGASEQCNPLSSMTPQERLKFFSSEMNRYYICCKDPVADLVKGIEFWCELMRIIDLLSVNINVSVLQDDMEVAHQLLVQSIINVGLYLHEAFVDSPYLTKLRASIIPKIGSEVAHSRPSREFMPATVAASTPPPQCSEGTRKSFSHRVEVDAMH